MWASSTYHQSRFSMLPFTLGAVLCISALIKVKCLSESVYLSFAEKPQGAHFQYYLSLKQQVLTILQFWKISANETLHQLSQMNTTW